jgi:hypothetical protein
MGDGLHHSNSEFLVATIFSPPTRLRLCFCLEGLRTGAQEEDRLLASDLYEAFINSPRPLLL